MRTFIGDMNTTVWNGKEKKASLVLGCYVEYDSGYNYFFENIDDFMSFTIQQEGNFFFHDLERFYGNFITEWLLKNGYSFGKETTAPENLNAFVVGEAYNFTVFTNSPQGYKIQNFFDTKKYLRETIPEIGKSVGLVAGNLRKFVYGDKFKITNSDKEILKMNCLIIKKALKKYGFVEAYENRIYSIGNYALQHLLYDKTDLELNRIDEFSPTKKPKGYKGTYTTKRFVRYQQETIRATKPKRFSFKNKQGAAHYKEILKAIQQVKRELSNAKIAGEIKKLEKEAAQLEKYRQMHAQYILRNERNVLGRDSYKGGFVYVNPRYRNQWIERPGITLDNNADYSYQLATKKLPKDYIDKVSSLEEFKKKYDTENHLYLAKVRKVRAKVKEGRIPVIKLRDEEPQKQLASLNQIRWQSISDEINFSTVLAQPDFEYLLENYDIQELQYELLVLTVDYELMEKASRYITYWNNKKIEAKKARDLFTYSESKAMLNTPIGYMGVKKNGGRSNTTNSYVCVASFINSYARVETARIANLIGLDYFCYSAVDSIHMILPDSCLSKGKYDTKKTLNFLTSLGIRVDSFELGAWKVEKAWNKAKFIGANCYGEREINGQWTSTISGYKNQVPIDDFATGFKGQQEMATKVEGGSLLLPVPFYIFDL